MNPGYGFFGVMVFFAPNFATREAFAKNPCWDHPIQYRHNQSTPKEEGGGAKRRSVALIKLLSQGAPKGRQQKGETGPGTHIFADFCRSSLIFGSLCKSRDLGVADLRRKPQETADFRRKPQKTADFCRNRFLPFAVSLLARSKILRDAFLGTA